MGKDGFVNLSGEAAPVDSHYRSTGDPTPIIDKGFHCFCIQRS